MLVQAHPAPRTARTRCHTLPVPGVLRPTQGRPHENRTLDRRGPARRRRPDRGRQQDFRAAGGFVLPAALGVAPVLVPVTAGCWVLLMIGAMATHLRHGEPKFAALNLTYLALAVFLAWGRA